MKTPSDQLFNLIESLDFYEKVYIKRCFSAKPNTKNEKLFSYLDSCTQYDEQKLLKSSDFADKHTIKQSKHQLYNYILKKLEVYYSEIDEEQKLYKLLFQIRLLHKKKHFEKAKQLLEFAIEKADRYNFFLLQIQLQREYQSLAIDSGDIHNYEKLKQENNTSVPVLLEYYQTDNYYGEQQIELTKLSMEMLSTEERKQKITDTYNTLPSKQDKILLKKLPIKTQLRINFLEYNCLLHLSDYDKAKTKLKTVLAIYEQNFDLIDREEQMLIHLMNGVALCNRTQDGELLLYFDNKADTIYESIPPKKKSPSIIDYYVGMKVNSIGFSIKNKQFDFAKITSEKLLKQIDFSKLRADVQKIFIANLCQIYLCCGEAQKALEQYNILTNTLRLKKTKKDIDYPINILGLTIFYDLDLYSNVESMIRSCKREREFKQQPFIYQHLIHFFGHIIQNKNANIIDRFASMIQAINSVNQTDKESLRILEGMEIRYWLESKLRGVDANYK